jgi:RNA polymerase sigma-70 factor (ECF subfamily)
LPIDVEAAYRQYGPMVVRRCRKLLQDEAAAVDAMHDVFVQLIREHQRLDERAPAALLMRMATRCSLNKLRTRRRRPETLDAEGELLERIATSPSAAGQVEARSFLERVFRREQESTGTIAVMHLLDGLTLEEVAAEVGLSVSGVRKRLRTLRARLPELELEV